MRHLAGLISLLVGAFTSAVFTLLTTTVSARYLGVADFGLFSTGLAAIGIVVPLASMGVAGFLLKELSGTGFEAIKYLRPSSRLLVIGVAIGLTLVLVFSFLQHEIELRNIVLLLALTIPGLVLLELLVCKLQIEERYFPLSCWQSALAVVRFFIVLVAFYFFSEMGSLGLAFVYVVSVCTIALAAVPLVRRLFRGCIVLPGRENLIESRVVTQDKVSIYSVFDQSWPFAASALLYLVYFQIDVVLLSFMVSSSEVGLYVAAHSLIAATYLLPNVVYQRFLMPKLHRFANQSVIQFNRIVYMSAGLMMAVGVCVTFLFWTSASLLVMSFYGDQYFDAIFLVEILVVCILFRFVSTSFGAPLNTSGLVKVKIRIMGFSAVVNVVLNLILIPDHGGVGAALATVVSEFLLMVLFVFTYYRKF